MHAYQYMGHRCKQDVARGLEMAIEEMLSPTPLKNSEYNHLTDAHRLAQDIKCRQQQQQAGYIFTIFE